MLDITDITRIVEHIADANTPDSTVSSLQTDFVKIIKTYNNEVFNHVKPAYVCEKLAVPLSSQMGKIRANTFRCFTLTLPNTTVEHVMKYNIDLYLVRAIDTGGGRDGTDALEGVEALKFVYYLAKYGPLPQSLICCLLSLVRSTVNETYKKCATAIICGYALTNPRSVIECGGIKCLLDAIAMGGEYQETEVLCQVFMFIFNSIDSRNFVHLDSNIGYLLAPLSDPFFVLFEKKGDNMKESDYVEGREIWLAGCKNAVLAMSRTWSGIYALKPVFQELTSAMKRPFSKIQRTVVKIFYEMFLLEQPTSLDSFEEALSSIIDWKVNPDWSICEDWVVGEAAHVLPPHHIERPNLVDVYQATLLALILSVDPKLDSMTHVAINGKKEEAILASILVGEMLHLINKFNLISEQHIAHIQPLLVAAVAEHKGFGVESSLCITKLLNHRRGLFPKMSYHLKLIKDRVQRFKHGFYPSYHYQPDHDLEERQHIRFIEDTKVLSNDDFLQWNWEAIASILDLGFFRQPRYRDETCIRFLHRIMEKFTALMLVTIHYYDDSTSRENSSKYTNVGISLINLFLEIECYNIEELHSVMKAFLRTMVEELRKSKLGAGIFTPNNIRTTLVSDYFFMIGALYSDVEGNKYLKNSNIFETYIQMFDKAANKDILMKCVLVSLSYGKENITDAIFSTILHRGSENMRVFAIKFLRLLIRTGYQNFEKFVLPMLVSQLYAYSSSNSDSEIVEEALDVLTEACQDRNCLEHLFDLFPALQHLGDKGYELILRYLSIPRGFDHLSKLGFVDSELEKWNRYKCLDYVRKVESHIMESFTSYERGEAMFRTTNFKFAKYCFTPVHMYGELSHFDAGIEKLQKDGIFQKLDQLLQSTDTLEIKAAVWAIGHIGASAYGFAKLSQFEFVAKLHNLAVTHSNLCVRGTCFYALNLICKTDSGCAAVEQYDFTASRQDFIHHHDVCQPISKKIGGRFGHGSISHEITNRQRSATLQPARVKTHTKNRSIGTISANQIEMIIQQVNAAPIHDCQETLPGEKIGLCIPNNIQKFFYVELKPEQPKIPEIPITSSDDEDIEQMINLVIRISSSLHSGSYCSQLENLAKNKKYIFSDINNYIIVNQIMAQYKFRQVKRRFIHRLFDPAMKSSTVGFFKSPSMGSITSSNSVTS